MVKEILVKAIGIFLVFTIICGILYTGAVTGIAQFLFPRQANGSIIEADGIKYGSTLLAQYYTDDAHMWGRIMKLDTSTFQDKEGNYLLYAGPSNLSPASEEYKALIEERVKRLREANPDMEETAVPVDLVTGSGSGLDPEISLNAARYQVARIADASGKTKEQVEEIIDQCTTEKFLGIFGERTVNVLKVNLMLDGILE